MNSGSDDARLGVFSRRLTILIVLSLLALSTRALPYSISILPFNNDGITEARIAEDILAEGHLTYPEGSFYVGVHSTITPVYNVMVAYSSSLIGIDTYTISQALIAVISILTVVGGYVIALGVSRSLLGSMSTSFILAFLGTFVYLTGSAWKGALGIALLVLLTFAYMGRSDRRFLLVEVCVLALLPVSYHLATVLALMTLAYLTCWSVLIGFLNKRLSLSHFVDVAIIAVASVAGYMYYVEASFKRLSDFGTEGNVMLLILAFSVLLFGAAVVLIRRKSLRISFAPIAGTVIAIVVIIDYNSPMFPYTQGYSSNVLLLGLIYGLVVSIGWFGFELLVRSDAKCRAIPLGLLLPVLTLFIFAITSGFELEEHKMFYRTFDYADLSLALGGSVAVAYIAKTRLRYVVVGFLTVALLCSFPFGYATGTLLGDRHDTQEYEVDAIAWIHDSVDSSTILRSDERLSYDARALYDFGKDPYLPSRLVSGDVADPDAVNLLLEEWMVTGVNDYPRGHPVLDEEEVHIILENANVLYVGGPESNNLIVFQTTSI